MGMVPPNGCLASAIRPYRERVILASKLFAETADDVRRSVEASLERLQVYTARRDPDPRHLVQRRRGRAGSSLPAAC